MGKVIEFCGSLDTGEEEPVAEVLGVWLGVGLRLRLRIRLLGWEVHHEDRTVEVYAQEALGLSRPCALVSGTAAVGPEEAHALFGALHALCVERGLGHTLEYQWTDERGAPLDDEVHVLTHP
ncbi:hypothetical protein [Actinocorallia populi]|uniref:hypothetical protein n=1 Tax=Actinocorallia populi TaxID=2079200 RepID=UPI000D087EBB|nr:hypothetical protein [Actinocorallia populi]